MRESPKILLILRPPLEHYPPSIYQANILSENGFRVSALQESKLSGNVVEVGLNPEIQRHYVFPSNPHRSFLGRIARVAAYRRKVRKFIHKFQPDIVIAYDAEAAWAIGRCAQRSGAKLVWHFHEIPEYQSGAWTINTANRFVWRHAKLADLIIFPDPGRAAIFAADSGIDVNTIPIVANSPRRDMPVPKPSLRMGLYGRIPPSAKILLYHGSIGSSHGLEAAIQSMPQWPDDVFFVAKGGVHPKYAERLTGLAASIGVANRFILFDPGFQPTMEHLANVAGADVGWTVLDPVSNNWKYSALASNKRFECMALGLPQITDSGALLKNLIESNNCGLCVASDSRHSIADAVNTIMSDSALRQLMSKRARQLFEDTYNYDVQFAPIIKILQKLCF